MPDKVSIRAYRKLHQAWCHLAMTDFFSKEYFKSKQDALDVIFWLQGKLRPGFGLKHKPEILKRRARSPYDGVYAKALKAHNRG